MKLRTIIALTAAAAALAALAVFITHAAFLHGTESGEPPQIRYKSITMEEAKAIFEAEASCLIVDVRRSDEFASGHIPSAINIPNESIGSIPPAELPDKNQTIYVYCRSGNRSKQASEKLSAMGYTGIVEFGGILDWTGNIEK